MSSLRQLQQLSAYHYVDTEKTDDSSFTHGDVLLDLLIGQCDGGAVVRRRRRQAEAVSDGAFRLSQRLLEVLDVPLSRHLQLLCLATHCGLAHYKDNKYTDITSKMNSRKLRNSRSEEDRVSGHRGVVMVILKSALYILEFNTTRF